MELYKKYRPAALNQVVGQDAAVSVLRTHIEKKTIPHSLLFVGPSGVSKTTLGRILKQELGCSDSDYNEINCADVRGIDGVRDIIRNMGFAPVGGTCRIWLLDECALLTREAQSTMLKMLEDTPDHCYFFLCTTDPQKLLPTIKTRCTEITLNSINSNDLTKLVNRIARKEGKTVPEEVVDQIVLDANGSARMALVLLDKVIDLPEADMALAAKTCATEQNAVIELCRVLLSKTGESGFRAACHVIKGLQDDPEGIRYAVLGYAKSVMLSGREIDKAYIIMNAFKTNFYDSKMSGVLCAVYEVMLGE